MLTTFIKNSQPKSMVLKGGFLKVVVIITLKYEIKGDLNEHLNILSYI